MAALVLESCRKVPRVCPCLLQWQLDVLPFFPAVSHLTFTTEPNTVHGHYGFPPYEKGSKPCKPATCKAAADWSYPLVDVSGGLSSSWCGASRLGCCPPLPAGRLVPRATNGRRCIATAT